MVHSSNNVPSSVPEQRKVNTDKYPHVLSHFCAQRLLSCTIRAIIYIKYVKAFVVPVASRHFPFLSSLPLCLKMWVKVRKRCPDWSNPAHPRFIDGQSTSEVKREKIKQILTVAEIWCCHLQWFHLSPQISSIRTCPRTEHNRRKPTAPCRWTEPAPKKKKKKGF